MQEPVTEIDRLFSKTKPNVDFYSSKLAFAIALNFPYYTPQEKEALGGKWSRKEWAMVRLGDRFSYRPNPEIKSEPTLLPEDLTDYTTLYIISMDQILSSEMEVIFPEGTRLNCHNGLRDEIKGLYTRENPLPRQRMIYVVVQRVLDQSIPKCMVGETEFYWNPYANEVYKKENNNYVKVDFEEEKDRRYRFLHNRFNSKIAQDVKYPDGSTYLTRTFENRQLSEKRIGFEDDMADFLGNHVIIDPIPSGGHANGAQMRGEKAHLRRRFEPYGLNYKGYRIGMHEIGHTIEQNISLYYTDFYSLKGIPSAPFTECMADLIAYRDVLGLGVSKEYSKKERELNALASFMYVWEMGAEGLHEIRVWNWFYEHPDATVEEFFAGKDFAEEMVRMCTIGKLTPDLWMMEATGEKVSSEPMLRAVRRAIKNYQE